MRTEPLGKAALASQGNVEADPTLKGHRSSIAYYRGNTRLPEKGDFPRLLFSSHRVSAGYP